MEICFSYFNTLYVSAHLRFYSTFATFQNPPRSALESVKYIQNYKRRKLIIYAEVYYCIYKFCVKYVQLPAEIYTFVFTFVAVVVFPRQLDPYFVYTSLVSGGLQNPGVQALAFHLGDEISPNYRLIHRIGHDIE